MADTVEKVEKIYCHDGGYGYRDNNDALYALLAQRNNCDPMAMAMMGNGGFGAGGWNNPFAYMMFMAMFRGFGGWGNDGMYGQNAQNIELQNQIQSLRTQLQDNQNSNLIMQAIGNGFNRNDFAISQLAQNLGCDFKTVQSAICQVQAAVQQVSGQLNYSAERVINAGQMGDMNIITALKDCCCNLREGISTLRADLQLQNCQNTGAILNGQRDTNAIVSQGIAQAGFIAEQNKCEIINAINSAQQRTSDLLNNHWSQEQQREIQDLKAEISNLRQTDRILGRLTGNPYYSGNGCCGNNFGGL